MALVQLAHLLYRFLDIAQVVIKVHCPLIQIASGNLAYPLCSGHVCHACRVDRVSMLSDDATEETDNIRGAKKHLQNMAPLQCKQSKCGLHGLIAAETFQRN
jgi:hypothetical protein